MLRGEPAKTAKRQRRLSGHAETKRRDAARGFLSLPSAIVSYIVSFSDARTYTRMHVLNQCARRIAELPSSSPHTIYCRQGSEIPEDAWRRLRPRSLTADVKRNVRLSIEHMRELSALDLYVLDPPDASDRKTWCSDIFESMKKLRHLTDLALSNLDTNTFSPLNLCAPMLRRLDLSQLVPGQGCALPLGLEELRLYDIDLTNVAHRADHSAIGQLAHLRRFCCEIGAVRSEFWDAILARERPRPAVLEEFCAPFSSLELASIDLCVNAPTVASEARAAAVARLPLRRLEFMQWNDTTEEKENRCLSAFLWNVVATCTTLQTLRVTGDGADEYIYADDLGEYPLDAMEERKCAELSTRLASAMRRKLGTIGSAQDTDVNEFERKVLDTRWLFEALGGTSDSSVRVGSSRMTHRDVEDRYMRKYDSRARVVKLQLELERSRLKFAELEAKPGNPRRANNFSRDINPARASLSCVCAFGLRRLAIKGTMFYNEAHTADLLSTDAPQLVSLKIKRVFLRLIPELCLGARMPKLQELVLRGCQMRRGLVALARLPALTDLDLWNSSGADDLSLLRDRCPLVRVLRMSERSKDPAFTIRTLGKHASLRNLQGFPCWMSKCAEAPGPCPHTAREAAHLAFNQLTSLPSNVSVCGLTLQCGLFEHEEHLAQIGSEADSLLAQLRASKVECGQEKPVYSRELWAPQLTW